MTSSQRVPVWNHLWQLILYAPKLYLLDSLLWLFIMGLPAVPGLIIREFFDRLVENGTENDGSLRSPLILVAWLLGVGLARIIVIFTGRITKTQHRFTISSLVQRNLLNQLLQKPGAEPLMINDRSISPGEVISFFREDAAQIEDNVVGTNEILGAGVFALASLVILFSVQARLTVLVFLPLVAIAVIVRYAETHIKRYRFASRQSTQQVTGLIGELFGSVQAIQVAGVETSVLHHFHQLNEQRRQRMVQDQVFTSGIQSVLENLVNLGTGLILLLAALLNSTGDRIISVGDFALFVYYLAFVTDFLWFMGGFLTLTKQTEVAFERIDILVKGRTNSTVRNDTNQNFIKNTKKNGNQNTRKTEAIVTHAPLYLPDIRFLTVQERMPKLPAVGQPLQDHTTPLQELKAIHLTYYYPGSDRGITDVSLTLKRSHLTVITGRVGSGKTTLLRVLLGLLPMQAGELYWNHQRILQPDQFLIPPRSAYTPQVPQLFSNTLQENLLLGLQRSEQELEQAIDLSVLEQDIAQMPDGLHTLIGSKGMRLSGGQQQRTAAARMLVRQPELLVFDDLSSALDLETEQKLWSRLFALKSSTSPFSASNSYMPTYLVVSHRLPVLRRADHLIVLNEGRIEAEGTFSDLHRHLPDWLG
ncbi:ATP-binding cassette domain-containing protein [Egbenema bharatensis]|uniref:ATP-binding cassette domain-containing protein n=1 Tax=Egbenema bharatensis TaxID=3463334 RepID=UPI003A842B85